MDSHRGQASRPRPGSFRVFDLVSVSFEFRLCACVLSSVEILALSSSTVTSSVLPKFGNYHAPSFIELARVCVAPASLPRVKGHRHSQQASRGPTVLTHAFSHLALPTRARQTRCCWRSASCLSPWPSARPLPPARTPEVATVTSSPSQCRTQWRHTGRRRRSSRDSNKRRAPAGPMPCEILPPAAAPMPMPDQLADCRAATPAAAPVAAPPPLPSPSNRHPRRRHPSQAHPRLCPRPRRPAAHRRRPVRRPHRRH